MHAKSPMLIQPVVIATAALRRASRAPLNFHVDPLLLFGAAEKSTPLSTYFLQMNSAQHLHAKTVQCCNISVQQMHFNIPSCNRPVSCSTSVIRLICLYLVLGMIPPVAELDETAPFTVYSIGAVLPSCNAASPFDSRTARFWKAETVGWVDHHLDSSQWPDHTGDKSHWPLCRAVRSWRPLLPLSNNSILTELTWTARPLEQCICWKINAEWVTQKWIERSFGNNACLRDHCVG
jgi:hypothetical protein